VLLLSFCSGRGGKVQKGEAGSLDASFSVCTFVPEEEGKYKRKRLEALMLRLAFVLSSQRRRESTKGRGWKP